MKLTCFLCLFSVTMAFATSSYAQKTFLSLKMSDKSIMEVLEKIESDTEFKFFYNSRLVNINRKVSVDVTNQDVFVILDQLFSGSDVRYRVIDRDVILTTASRGGDESGVSQQRKALSGTIKDESGLPIIGANIMEKGTGNGTVTDTDGNFSLAVSANAVLQISYIGYLAQEINVGNQTNLQITLKEDQLSLDEVVVIGYGTQKKTSLTGSIATINAAEIQSVPASNLSNALGGRLSGVFISQSNGGRPGNSAGISVRVPGSWNSTAPLYVIDGVVRDKFAFDGLAANDVDQLSILKDGASAAIYGARAANGVVLVTTKKGQIGKPVISYTGSVGISDLTTIPPTQNAYNHARFINDALRTGGFDSSDARWFTDDELEYFKTHSYDWIDEAWRNPLVTQHSLDVTGGNERVRYFIGGNYFYETGAFDNMKFNKYTVRGNIEANITKDLVATLNITSDIRDDLKPYWRNDDSSQSVTDTMDDLWNMFTIFAPKFFPAYIDGKPVGGSAIVTGHAPEIVSPSSGYSRRKYNNGEISASLQYSVPFVKGLSLKALYNNYNRQIFNKKFNVNYTLYEFKTTGQHNHILTNEPTGTTVQPVQHNLLKEQYDRENSYQFNFFVNYARTFGLHDVNAVFVYEQSEGLTDWFNAQTTGFVSATVDQLFAGSRSTSDFSLDGSGSETGRLSYAGRVHYGYAEKYLIDLAFRYDGSVKFAPPQRWGFFPSVGAAWRISEENFFKNNVRFIDYLKLKASVGLTGNDAVGGWQWQENYVSDAGAQYGDIARGLRAGVIPNPLVTWEKSLIYDGGLEFAFLKNRLTLGLTTFYKHTYDVLGGRTNTIPSTFGGNMPSENYGEVDARGYEVELGFTDKVGNLIYRVGGNLAYATNKIVTMDEGENYPAYRSKIGLNNDRRLGFVYTDIIRTQADLDALPEGYTINGATPMLGMLNYKDVRGVNSDQPDGKITDEDKEWIITHNIPPVTYGFYLGAQWKGFDLNLFFQGVAGMQLMDNQRLTVNHGRTNTYAIWEDHWTPENVNAKFPRAENSGWHTYPESSFWVYNGSFLRLKNLSFSYTLPKHILSNLGVGQAKIFFTGTNLLLLEDHVKYFDPELGDTDYNVRRFPLTKSYSLGINLSF